VAPLAGPDTGTEQLAEVAGRLDDTDSGVVLLIGAPQACSDAAAELTQIAVDHAGVHPTDIRIATPRAERWSVDDVTSQITSPVTNAPLGNRWLLTVADVDSMGDAALTRLLRTLEEPPSPAWFLLCHCSGVLPAPVLGRVTFTQLVGDTGDTGALVDNVAAAGLTEQLRALTLLPDSSSPDVSWRWGNAARALADQLRPKAAPMWQRRIAAAALDAWESQLAELIDTAEPAELTCIADSLRSIGAARADLDSYVPIAAVMHGPCSAIAALTRGR
jgi:hypothetical protein